MTENSGGGCKSRSEIEVRAPPSTPADLHRALAAERVACCGSAAAAALLSSLKRGVIHFTADGMRLTCSELSGH
jgi:hypothetical protein